jgi:hypothetical protein
LSWRPAFDQYQLIFTAPEHEVQECGSAQSSKIQGARNAPLQKIDRMVDQDRAENAMRFGEHVLQRFFDVLFGIGKSDNADRGALPDVVKIELSDGNVELAAKTILEAAENLALVLQGASIRDVQFERQQANGHSQSTCSRANKRAREYHDKDYLRAEEPACAAASAPLTF